MRQKITTYAKRIDETNVVEVLNKAYSVHLQNVADEQFLLNFDSGIQPLQRVKKVRPDINVVCIDNVCHEVAMFNEGYYWGNPITLIQRGKFDSGNLDEPIGIALLNEQYEGEGIKSKTQLLGHYVEVTNLGYTHVDINADWEEGESYFKINALDPRYTFIVKSSYYLDERDMMSVTFGVDDNGVRHFTCTTKDTRYDVSEDKIVNMNENSMGCIPVIEWTGNHYGMGCFEHQIDEANTLNLMASDFANDVEQNTQAIWHANDVDFPMEEKELEDGTKIEVVKNPKTNEWTVTFTTKDGKTPFIKPLSIEYDLAGMLENIKYRRNLILEKCFVPQRVNDSGGSTGVASNVMSGYSATEIIADTKQSIQATCKMKEVKAVLAAIKASPYVPEDSPLLKLTVKDIQPNIKRMKLSEMSTKVNSLATLISHGVDGKTAFATVNLFEDANQAYVDSIPTLKRYQDSIFDKNISNEPVGGLDEQKPNSDRIMQDLSDQVSNSPNLRA